MIGTYLQVKKKSLSPYWQEVKTSENQLLLFSDFQTSVYGHQRPELTFRMLLISERDAQFEP
jgi:hypothetical protein